MDKKKINKYIVDVSCLGHLDGTDAGGEPGDVGYTSLAERESRH